MVMMVIMMMVVIVVLSRNSSSSGTSRIWRSDLRASRVQSFGVLAAVVKRVAQDSFGVWGFKSSVTMLSGTPILRFRNWALDSDQPSVHSNPGGGGASKRRGPDICYCIFLARFCI